MRLIPTIHVKRLQVTCFSVRKHANCCVHFQWCLLHFLRRWNSSRLQAAMVDTS